MTFKEKYLAGEIRFEEIDDYIEILEQQRRRADAGTVSGA